MIFMVLSREVAEEAGILEVLRTSQSVYLAMHYICLYDLLYLCECQDWSGCSRSTLPLLVLHVQGWEYLEVFPLQSAGSP